MRSLLHRQKAPQGARQTRHYATNAPRAPRFLVPTLILGSVVGGGYWAAEKFDLLPALEEWKKSIFPGSPVEVVETQKKAPVETAVPVEPISHEQPVDSTAVETHVETPHVEVTVERTVHEETSQEVVHFLDEPGSSPVDLEVTVVCHPGETLSEVVCETKTTELVESPAQDLPVVEVILVAPVTEAPVDVKHQELETLQEKISSLETTLEKVTNELSFLETISKDYQQQNQELVQTHQQIKEQLEGLNLLNQQKIAELNEALKKRDEIEVSPEIMTRVASELLNNTIRENIELKASAQQELLEQKRRYTILLEEYEEQRIVELEKLHLEFQQQQERLVEAYQQDKEKLAAYFKQGYEKAAQDLVNQKRKQLETEFVKYVASITETLEAEQAQLGSLQQQQQAMGNDLHNLQADHEKTLHLLSLTKGLLLLQFAQKHCPQPINNQLEEVKSITKDDPLLQRLLNNIPVDEASKGIKTLAQLTTDFNSISEKARQMELKQLNESKGLVAAVYEYAKSSSTPGLVSGTDLHAVLSRCQYHLERQSIEAVFKELAFLDKSIFQLYEPWLHQARARFSLDQAVSVYQSHLLLEIPVKKE